MLSCFQIRGRFGPAQTFNRELIVIIVKGFQLLTIITKSSILDVAAVLNPPLQIVEHLSGNLWIVPGFRPTTPASNKKNLKKLG